LETSGVNLGGKETRGGGKDGLKLRNGVGKRTKAPWAVNRRRPDRWDKEFGINARETRNPIWGGGTNLSKAKKNVGLSKRGRHRKMQTAVEKQKKSRRERGNQVKETLCHRPANETIEGKLAGGNVLPRSEKPIWKSRFHS